MAVRQHAEIIRLEHRILFNRKIVVADYDYYVLTFLAGRFLEYSIDIIIDNNNNNNNKCHRR